MCKKKILIVEDELITAMHIHDVLVGRGYQVDDIITSGEKAVARAREQNPDLILMDIMLEGDMDGIQAVQEIVSTQDIPVIYMTAHSDESTLSRAKDTRPYGYVLKPFNHNELKSTVDLVLYKHEMEKKLSGSRKELERKNFELEAANEMLQVTIAELETMNEELMIINDEFEASNNELVISKKELQDSEFRYHTLFSEMIDGYALHEVICDKSGTPVDYQFLDVNPAFLKITGFPDNIIGKRVREIIPDIENVWIERYGDVALGGEPVSFVEYSASLKKWFQVRAFSPGKRSFACVFKDITREKEYDNEIDTLNTTLGKRYKELQCLYSIADIIEREGINVPSILNEIVSILPVAWRYPDYTAARIVYKNTEFATGNFSETAWVQKAVIKESGVIIGSIEVVYLKEMPECDEGPFLHEERFLLNTVAKRIGKIAERNKNTETLRLYEKIISASPNPISYIDRDYRLKVVNEAFASYFNQSCDAIVGDTISDIMGGDTFYGPIIDNFAERIDGNVVRNLEWYNFPGNTRRYLEMNYHPHVNDKGTIEGFVVTGNDLTEVKRKEEIINDVLHSLTMSQFSVENASINIFWITPEGNFIYANNSALNSIGYTAEEINIMNVCDIDPNYPLSKRPEQWEMLKVEKVAVFETMHRKKDGSVFPVQITSNYLDYDGQEYEFAFVQDISERKKTEERDLLGKRKLESLWGIAQLVHKDDEVIYEHLLNEIIRLTDSGYAFYCMMGPGEEIVSMYSCSENMFRKCGIDEIQDMYTMSHSGCWRSSVRERRSVIINDYAADIPCGKSLPDGFFTIHRFMSVPVFSHGKIVAVAGVGNKGSDYIREDMRQIASFLNNIQIILDFKNSESLLRASLSEKEILLKEVHHRVKNNMQIISSLISLQERFFRDDVDRELLIKTQMRIRSMALVHESLYQAEDLARIDFQSYVDDLIAELYYSSVIGQHITIRKNIDCLFLTIDLAIPCALIVNELVTNALKHAFPDNRTGVIDITLAKGDEVNRLEICDDGIGIRNDIEIDKTDTLGLQLVKGLVKQMRGEMKVTSMKGTRWSVVFKSDK